MTSLGTYLGARLMTSWTAFLNVYGAEESPEFEYEDSFKGVFPDCLGALKKFQEVIDDNCLDAYLSLQNDRGQCFEGDLEHVLEHLEDYGYITEAEYDQYARYYR